MECFRSLTFAIVLVIFSIIGRPAEAFYEAHDEIEGKVVFGPFKVRHGSLSVNNRAEYLFNSQIAFIKNGSDYYVSVIGSANFNYPHMAAYIINDMSIGIGKKCGSGQSPKTFLDARAAALDIRPHPTTGRIGILVGVDGSAGSCPHSSRSGPFSVHNAIDVTLNDKRIIVDADWLDFTGDSSIFQNLRPYFNRVRNGVAGAIGYFEKEKLFWKAFPQILDRPWPYPPDQQLDLVKNSDGEMNLILRGRYRVSRVEYDRINALIYGSKTFNIPLNRICCSIAATPNPYYIPPPPADLPPSPLPPQPAPPPTPVPPPPSEVCYAVMRYATGTGERMVGKVCRATADAAWAACQDYVKYYSAGDYCGMRLPNAS